ncbi:hypothetical protein [Methanoculleus sp.]|jgi:hypothetical protein|uniref:hypothetical protein n=1 Tax=Methanoculleus sp. TaxID=90427 RepID=UPI0025FFDFD7|nr:hypothetical protein [Methanoculleus sp.]MCK9319493.1 hypothetical protein [Methanoculleus sp.]
MLEQYGDWQLEILSDKSTNLFKNIQNGEVLIKEVINIYKGDTEYMITGQFIKESDLTIINQVIVDLKKEV